MNQASSHSVDLELLGRYMAGECNLAERQRVQDWRAASEENQAEFAALEQIWGGGESSAALVNVDQAWQKVRTRTIAPAGVRKNRRKLPVAWLAAAVLILAATVILLVLRSGIGSPELTTFANATERVQSHRLPDGSVVDLRPGAAVTYAADFAGEERLVQFAGEGYFDVERDPEHPFVVSVGGAEVRVLGTEFLLRDSAGVDLQVTEGKVVFSAKAAATGAESGQVLVAGESARYDVATDRISGISQADPNDLFWKSRRLTYRNAPLRRVAADLERYFPISVRFENDALRDCRLSATFDDEAIDSIFRVISESMNLTFEKDGTTFTLLGTGC